MSLKGHSLSWYLGFCFLQREVLTKGKTVMFAAHQFVPGTVFQLHCCLAGHCSEMEVQAQRMYKAGVLTFNKILIVKHSPLKYMCTCTCCWKEIQDTITCCCQPWPFARGLGQAAEVWLIRRPSSLFEWPQHEPLQIRQLVLSAK